MSVCTVGRSKKTVVALTIVAVVVPLTQSLFDFVYHGKLHRGVTTTRWITIFVFFVALPLATLVVNVVVICAVRRTRKNDKMLGN